MNIYSINNEHEFLSKAETEMPAEAEVPLIVAWRSYP
jgi:hypothetical protein